MDNVTTLVTDRERHIQNVQELLEEAKGQGFVEVVIVGRRADDTVAWQRSSTMSFLRLVGALEWAKTDAIQKLDTR